MDIIRKFIRIGSVKCIVEIYDAYFYMNFKGWHTESFDLKMPSKVYQIGIKQDNTKEQTKKEKRRTQ